MESKAFLEAETKSNSSSTTAPLRRSFNLKQEALNHEDVCRLKRLAALDSSIRTDIILPAEDKDEEKKELPVHHELRMSYESIGSSKQGKKTRDSHDPMQAYEFNFVNGEESWHALEVEEVMRKLGTSTLGLSQKEAIRRLGIFGPNKLTEAQKTSFWKRLWNQLNSVVVFILFFAMVVSAALQDWVDVGLIGTVVLVNTIIGMVQEGKAEKAAEAIKNMLTSTAMVVRSGQRTAIAAENVVPGDVVFIQSGDRIPADVRLFDVSSMQTSEAMLTGESLPVAKNIKAVAGNAALGDRKCIGYSATSVVKGQGLGLVVATGDFAEIGKINELLNHVEQAKSNLTVQIDMIGKMLSVIVFTLGMITWITYVVRHRSEFETLGIGQVVGIGLTRAVAVAVAIIPEGLPALVTITLALAVSQMAKKKAIVRQLPCVETLGSVNVICSDKTGTLTKNEMTVVEICTAAGTYPVSGVGYAPNGAIEHPKPAEISKWIQSGVLCNDSNLVLQGGFWTPVGDPTEVALLTLAEKAMLNRVNLLNKHPRLRAIPFESEYKFMATFHEASTFEEERMDSDSYLLIVKGAPDRLVAKCAYQGADNTLANIDSDYWLNQTAELSAKGLRVLALCSAVVPKNVVDKYDGSVPASFLLESQPFLTMNMLVAILDPPREECISAIKTAHRAGITVKMITGDHAQTAVAIGRMLGIVDEEHSMVITGPELDTMTDEQVESIVLDCNVFARSSPENKIRIVKALQARGQTSSMTGDGVNDAPALRAADIGVAMGITGTDVSKEAAKIVLADDNFATILSAVEVGRQVWENLRKILHFNQPVNFAQGLSILFALILNVPEPLNTAQVLYVNMITAVTVGLMFAAEPAEDGIMSLPPRRRSKRLIGKKFIWRSFLVSTILVAMVLGSYMLSLRLINDSVLQARGVAFNTLVFAEIAYALTCRFVQKSACHPRVFKGNNWAYVSVASAALLQVLITYIPGLNTAVFGLEALTPVGWFIVMTFAIGTFVIVEIEKKILDPVIIPFIAPFFPSITEKGRSYKRLPEDKVEKEQDLLNAA